LAPFDAETENPSARDVDEKARKKKMAKSIYYTVTHEAKNVYHTDVDCEEGKKIETKDKMTREQCEVCAKKD
jgi:hypothetical protein